MTTTPSVLFVCVKNGGKSQMAAALMRKVAPEFTVYSAGTKPGTKLNEASRASVEEVGASFDGEYAKPIDPAWLDEVDRVVIIGTEAVIENPGKAPIEVWETDEPSLRGIEGDERMRLVRDDIRRRVEALADELRTHRA